MMCSIIRDLLPLYEESLCSKESASLVEEHLKECDECRKLYDEMHKDIGLKEAANKEGLQQLEDEKNDINKNHREFWRKYYGSLLLKGIGIFLITYILSVAIGMILGRK